MANTTPEYLDGYFEGFEICVRDVLDDPAQRDALVECVRIIEATRGSGATVFLVGNGGSAAIAEHMTIDLTKNAGLRAMAFSGTPTITTLANDYGYEHAFAQALDRYARPGDVLIAISSGGTSRNILNTVAVARRIGMTVLTFSGFDPDNPLRAAGDVNVYVDSKAYGYVEMAHNLLIHYVNDAIIGAVEYVIR
ncbi:MAG: SIS domain-containing protein [Coriobacteriia bacterium]